MDVNSKSRFGVYLPRNLLKELDELVKATGAGNRSRVLQEALRLYIAEYRWGTGGRVVGSVNVLYNHEVGDVDRELTDVQHKFSDVIVSTMHIHLDRETCMLIVAVRGDSIRIRELINKLSGVRGVLLVRPVLLRSEQTSVEPSANP